MEKNKKYDKKNHEYHLGGIGAEAAIELRNRKGGAMPPRNTRRNRTRSAQKANAIYENSYS